jgi:uncharacterized protein with HEPN domain
MKRGKVTIAEREAAFLRDILVEGKDVEEFTKGLSLVTFSCHRLVRKAVTKCLESIAEATKNLTPALKARHPAISWRQVAAFRDFSAHQHWEIDYGIVWDIVQGHLPQLIAAVEEELGKLGTPQS